MPIWGWVCVGLTVAFILFIVYLNVADRKKRARTLEQGEHTHGWLVQAHSNAFAQGNMNEAGLVVISRDPVTNDDEDFMSDLADRIMSLKQEGEVVGDTKAERVVSKLMSDETYRQGLKTKLPLAFTDDREVYLVHIYIYRDHLPEKRLTGRKIPCAVVWDDPDAMVCTRPEGRKKRRRSEEDDD